MQLTSFASGSRGNCYLLSEQDRHILLDAGISMKRVKDGLSLSGLTPEQLSGILITHEHSDHISGLSMLCKHYHLPVYAPRTVARHLRQAAPGVEACLREIPVGEAFSLAGFCVTAFPTPHDTEQSVGYRVEGERIFALATDMGQVTPAVEAGLRGADAVLIEANHDLHMLARGPYPYHLKQRILSPHGHLSNDDCARLAAMLAEQGTRCIILGHLSRDNNSPALAYQRVSRALEGKDVQLCTAPANEPLCLDLGRSEACCR